jgi:hypothetical protein
METAWSCGNRWRSEGVPQVPGPSWYAVGSAG